MKKILIIFIFAFISSTLYSLEPITLIRQKYTTIFAENQDNILARSQLLLNEIEKLAHRLNLNDTELAKLLNYWFARLEQYNIAYDPTTKLISTKTEDWLEPYKNCTRCYNYLIKSHDFETRLFDKELQLRYAIEDQNLGAAINLLKEGIETTQLEDYALDSTNTRYITWDAYGYAVLRNFVGLIEYYFNNNLVGIHNQTILTIHPIRSGYCPARPSNLTQKTIQQLEAADECSYKEITTLEYACLVSKNSNVVRILLNKCRWPKELLQFLHLKAKETKNTAIAGLLKPYLSPYATPVEVRQLLTTHRVRHTRPWC